MPLALTDQTVSKFLNWIKCALAILYTTKEIEPVVRGAIEQFQQNIKDNVTNANNLQPEATCFNCLTEQVVPCPTNQICPPVGRCNYHKNYAKSKIKYVCPNKICHNLKFEIDKAHRYKGPSYRNTDAKQWCSNPWEIAKCFMPDGYRMVRSSAETDFNGLMSIIINYTGFDTKITADLSIPTNIFVQGRDVGKAVRHSSKLELEDIKVTHYFTVLIKILSDAKFMTPINSTNAIHKLTQLQNDDLNIFQGDILKILDDAREEIHGKLALDLIDTVKSNLEDQGNISLTQLNDALQLSIDALETKTQEGKKILDDTSKRGVEDVDAATKKALTEIQEAKQNESSKQDTEIATIWKWITWPLHWIYYWQKKKELKNAMIKFNKSRHGKVALSQLFDEIETPLAGFYVKPNIESIEQLSFASDQEKRTPIHSLEDLFTIENEERKELYLLADAGFGKTAFSKYLATIWCDFFSIDKNPKFCFTNEEPTALSSYDFLFLVLLRDSTDVCKIDKMIEQQIIAKQGRSAAQYPLQDILDKEKCLIILDGLDEWTHPKNGCRDKHENIPHRNACGDNCVILTTTRPWKLGESSQKMTDIHKKVELVQLSKDSARKLEKNAIRKIMRKPDLNDVELEKITMKFDKAIEAHCLDHMRTVPLLLMYLLCIWCNRKSIGDSLLDVYTNITDFLLSRLGKTTKLKQHSEPCHIDIPKFFSKHTSCQKFYPLLNALAKLAYHTLLNDKRENAYVFARSTAETYLKGDNMQLSLDSGILTESKSTTVTKETKNVSFSHKTVQGFFAAIFISSLKDTQNSVLAKCKNVERFRDLSVIWEFLCKMNSRNMLEILKGLIILINKNDDEETLSRMPMSVMDNDDISSTSLFNIQKLLLSYLKEMPESENFELHLLHYCINDATVHDERLKRLLKMNKENIKSLYINTCKKNISLSEIIELFSLTDLIKIKKLNFIGIEKEADISMLLFPTLLSLYLSSATWTNSEGTSSKTFESLNYLQYLNLSNLRMSHAMLEAIFNSIPGKNALKEVRLDRLSCIEHNGVNCRTCFNLDLSKLHQLKRIDLNELPPIELNLTTPSLVYVQLSFINLGENSSFLSREMCNIECMKLWELEISLASYYELIKVRDDLPKSVKVDMQKMLVQCRVCKTSV